MTCMMTSFHSGFGLSTLGLDRSLVAQDGPPAPAPAPAAATAGTHADCMCFAVFVGDLVAAVVV